MGASSIVPDLRKFMGIKNKVPKHKVAGISALVEVFTIMYPKYPTTEVMID
jgi:hypothetical protein